MNTKSLQSSRQKLLVFTTSRGKRDYFGQIDNSLPTKTLTIGDFLKRAIFVKDKIFIESDIRKLLLVEASNFDNFKDLSIPTDFFRFLENSPFILRFFDELSSEYVTLEDIETKDTYGEYDYHISILKKLLDRYKEILSNKGFTDAITMVDEYEINRDYINRFDEITIHFEGYFTNYEQKLYEELGKITNLHISLTLTPFDKKLESSFLDIFLPKNSKVLVDITNKKIIKEEPLSQPKSVAVIPVNNRIEEIAAIKMEIESFVKNGVLPEEIAVIIPDETFAQTIMIFDKEENFNFAKGISYRETDSYKILDSIERFKNEESIENRDRLKVVSKDLTDNKELLDSWSSERNTDEIIKILENYNFSRNGKESEIYREELYKLGRILEKIKVAKVKEVVHLFLSKLKLKTLDHKGGGKVTVLGLLETRECDYKGIIIIDFNESYAPRDSIKDLFINSAIKKRISLPSIEDRENYQKSLYYKILQKANMSSIIYVDNDENRPSRFLRSMNLDLKYKSVGKNINSLLFNIGKKTEHYQKEIVEKIDLTQESLSNSKFKSYLECRRKFYYRYIKKLKPHLDEKAQKPFLVGQTIHKILNDVYTKERAYSSFKTLEHEIKQHFDKHSKKDINLKYNLAVWMEKLKPFIENEIQRFEDGYRVLHMEKEFKANYQGILLNGKIDRIDSFGEGVVVLDYKTGKINSTTLKTLEKLTDFQLVFYNILLNENYKIDSLGLYDLKIGKIIYEDLLEEKLDMFNRKIKEYKEREQNFMMTEDHSRCIFCDYKLLCDR